MANVATVLLNIGDEHDLRMPWMRIMREKNALDLAKTAGEVDKLELSEVLLPKAEYGAVVERGLYGGEFCW
jgi:hypothetical protein